VTAPAAHPPVPGPAVSEISALIAWMRRLSDAGVHRADPAELAAFRHAKQDLLTRLEHHDRTPAAPHDQPGDPDD
jgi:hypothetical protein